MCKQITFREADRVLTNNGFKLDRINGSHYQYVRNGQRVTVNLKINKMVWRRLCKENKIIF